MDPIQLRRIIRKRRPSFRAQDSHKKRKIRAAWRRPKGMHSKIRLGKKGYNVLVNRGYRSPKSARGLSRGGKQLVTVSNPAMLAGLTKDCEIVIPASLGLKKRLLLMRAALERGIAMQSFRDPQGFITKAEAARAHKKEEAAKRAQEKEKKKQEKERKAEKKAAEEKAAPEAPAEEKKEEERREAERVLTKKEG
jgi:large subunit ribosomal protein L32e